MLSELTGTCPRLLCTRQEQTHLKKTITCTTAIAGFETSEFVSNTALGKYTEPNTQA
jgi:hypothetical protein